MEDPSLLTPAGERILSVAGELFYRQGLHAVGVALIAQTAGVTKKTLYDCFGSKDALVVRYLQRRHQRWWDDLEQRLAAADPPRALTLFDAYTEHPDLDTDRGCAFLNAAVELPPGHPGLDVVREHKSTVRRRLDDLVAEARPGHDTAEISEALFLCLEGATSQLLLGDRAPLSAARHHARAHLADR